MTECPACGKEAKSSKIESTIEYFLKENDIETEEDMNEFLKNTKEEEVMTSDVRLSVYRELDTKQKDGQSPRPDTDETPYPGGLQA